MIRFLGIRHHGPGCASSLLRALEEIEPDCVLIEGPPEAEAVLSSVLHPEIEPPVALLLYCPDDPRKASFYPFARFSPEWQAMRFGLHRQLPVRLIDLPQTHDLALRGEDSPPADAVLEAPAELDAEAAEVTTNTGCGSDTDEDISLDPLDWLGRAAGFADGESWWNRLVEERRDSDSAGLFAAIQEAMTTVRDEVPRPLSDEARKREGLREAHMRKCMRQAEKDGFQNIVVICGAWHVPALAKMPTAKADNDLLKGLPKVKVTATWAPWTSSRLASASGYSAGVSSPGWYDFLWKNRDSDGSRLSIGWISRVARFLREHDLDCSSAHVIEAARLSDTLAALRGRSAAGLDELNEAVRSVICMGDDAPLRLIQRHLIVGEELGRIPPDVPTVPLQQDLEKQQRSLRLKPEALRKSLDLDLRAENDLRRSHLLHRLRLLGIEWGTLGRTGYSSKGTFHEIWELEWVPEFAIRLIEASRWGPTIVDAASARAIDFAEQATSLPALSELVDRVLLANLPAAVPPVTQALENKAAASGDVIQLLDAIPPLANVFRYGNVRQTDASLVGHVLDGLVARTCIGLGGACSSLDDEAATQMRSKIATVHQALHTIGNEVHLNDWLPVLSRLAEPGHTHGLVGGLAARLLFDGQHADVETTGRRMSLALSVGTDPAPGAAWLEGFLHQSGMLLLHDDRLWQTLDAWLTSLSDEGFTRVLPLLRRTFAQFQSHELTQLGTRAKQAGASASTATATTHSDDDWNETRGLQPLGVLRLILGLR